MRITLSDRTILVNLLTPLQKKRVEAFSSYTKDPDASGFEYERRKI
jgi:hypothetical protein